MKIWSFQELMGLILSVGIIAVLNLLAWKRVLDPAMVGGAEIGWVGLIIGFFYRKAKPPAGGGQ